MRQAGVAADLRNGERAHNFQTTAQFLRRSVMSLVRLLTRGLASAAAPAVENPLLETAAQAPSRIRAVFVLASMAAVLLMLKRHYEEDGCYCPFYCGLIVGDTAV